MGKVTICPQCGATFEGPWFKRFCSDECRAAYHAARRRKGLALLERVEGPENLPTAPKDEPANPRPGQPEVSDGLGPR